MKIEEAMVYLLASSQHGMKTEQIARELELRGLVPRRAGKPLDGTGSRKVPQLLPL